MTNDRTRPCPNCGRKLSVRFRIYANKTGFYRTAMGKLCRACKSPQAPTVEEVQAVILARMPG